ncbi:MAG TPA: TOBE domain-containing protein, partial [Azonexus sp.]|nr:TOBE domain-containing protein [Azonexus sp.]
LEFPGGHIHVSRRGEPVGTTLRCRIHARDVSLALVPQTQASILNCVGAHVVDLAATTTPGHVMVRLDVAGNPLLARITKRSAHRLDIRPGLTLYAQIKSVALLG